MSSRTQAYIISPLRFEWIRLSFVSPVWGWIWWEWTEKSIKNLFPFKGPTSTPKLVSEFKWIFTIFHQLRTILNFFYRNKVKFTKYCPKKGKDEPKNTKLIYPTGSQPAFGCQPSLRSSLKHCFLTFFLILDEKSLTTCKINKNVWKKF